MFLICVRCVQYCFVSGCAYCLLFHAFDHALLTRHFRRFVVSGEEMETRATHAELHLILRKCFGMTPLEKFELQQLEKQVLGNKQRVTITTKVNNNSEDRSAKNETTAGEVENQEQNSHKDGTFMRGSRARLSQG